MIIENSDKIEQLYGDNYILYWSHTDRLRMCIKDIISKIEELEERQYYGPSNGDNIFTFYLKYVKDNIGDDIIYQVKKNNRTIDSGSTNSIIENAFLSQYDTLDEINAALDGSEFELTIALLHIMMDLFNVDYPYKFATNIAQAQNSFYIRCAKLSIYLRRSQE